jgi:TldD protein
MNNAIEHACARIMTPVGLVSEDLNRVLAKLSARSLDGGDLYFQARRSESWSLEDGVVREGGSGISQGAGVRAISGERVGFAHSDELALPALIEAARAARAIARSGGNGLAPTLRDREIPARYSEADPLVTLSADAKVRLLEQVDRAARAVDPRVCQVMVSLVASHETVLMAATDGTLAADHRPLVRLSVRVVAEQGGRREQGSSGGGGRFDLETLAADDRALGFAREAARQALVNLEAEEAPAGTMTVVLGPGWPGVLLHEAVGHGLEGDFNRKGTSAFAGRMGERVASPLCTVVDDGTLPARRGSLTMDDEGTPSQCTVLIENGVLRAYLQDKHNARLMGTASTGNGRRESFAHLPLPRMTNTYMLAGPHDPGEILASVQRGLYAVNFAGGQVDITSGRFVFSASEAYLIENGRVTRPVKGATLIGNGPEVLNRISMVGSDLALDAGVGVCGKEGQSVPVGVGQPTLRVDGLTVGGTRA